MSKSNVQLFSISGTEAVISKLPLLSDSPSYIFHHSFTTKILSFHWQVLLLCLYQVLKTNLLNVTTHGDACSYSAHTVNMVQCIIKIEIVIIHSASIFPHTVWFHLIPYSSLLYCDILKLSHVAWVTQQITCGC
jgi:hypothetical protein